MSESTERAEQASCATYRIASLVFELRRDNPGDFTDGAILHALTVNAVALAALRHPTRSLPENIVRDVTAECADLIVSRMAQGRESFARRN